MSDTESQTPTPPTAAVPNSHPSVGFGFDIHCEKVEPPMSAVAPWLALSVDWMDSEMFDEATHGERLAWICLLCYAKSNGRGGKVRLRKNAFQQAYRLSERAVLGMLERAQKCAAIEINGDLVTLCNWRVYQQKAWKAAADDCSGSGETEEKSSTKHPSPSTKHPQPTADRPPRERDLLWDAFCEQFGLRPATKQEKSRVGGLVTQLRAYEAAPEEIAPMAARYAKLHPDWTLSPESLVKWWPAIKPKKRAPKLQEPVVAAPEEPRLPPEERMRIFKREASTLSQQHKPIKEAAS